MSFDNVSEEGYSCIQSATTTTATVNLLNMQEVFDLESTNKGPYFLSAKQHQRSLDMLYDTLIDCRTTDAGSDDQFKQCRDCCYTKETCAVVGLQSEVAIFREFSFLYLQCLLGESDIRCEHFLVERV